MSVIFLTVTVCFQLAFASKPNVIVLVVDDVGYADMGFMGSNFPTPNVDRIVSEGVFLERMYAMPQCSPTRAALMTGRFAFRQGMQHWTTLLPGSTAALPKEYKTIAGVMRDVGYSTHAIGKWHLGYASKEHIPTGVSFDTYMGYLQGQTDYYNHTIPVCANNGRCIYRNDDATTPYGGSGAAYDFWEADKIGLRLLSNDFGKYTMDLYMKRFEQILENQLVYAQASPLFVYFAEQTLHIPLQEPPEPIYAELCRNVTGGTVAINRTVLCSMAARLDAAIGNIELLLKKYNIWNNTVVWVYSDNGGMTEWSNQFPSSVSSNFPLRGGKTTVFEGGVRSMSFVFGGAIPDSARGTSRPDLLHAVDILPTVAALAGADVSALEKQLDGVNAWGAITGNGPSVNRTELPLNIAINQDLVRTGGDIPCFGSHCHQINYTALIVWPYKLILGHPYIRINGEDRDRGGYWTIDNYSYVPPPEAFDATDVRLYDLEKDEAEKVNIAKQNPDIVSTMTKRIQDVWLNEDLGYRRPQLNLPHPQGNPKLHNWTWAPFSAS